MPERVGGPIPSICTRANPSSRDCMSALVLKALGDGLGPGVLRDDGATTACQGRMMMPQMSVVSSRLRRPG